jgi:hypothetical protein
MVHVIDLTANVIFFVWLYFVYLLTYLFFWFYFLEALKIGLILKFALWSNGAMNHSSLINTFEYQIFITFCWKSWKFCQYSFQSFPIKILINGVWCSCSFRLCTHWRGKSIILCIVSSSYYLSRGNKSFCDRSWMLL